MKQHTLTCEFKHLNDSRKLHVHKQFSKEGCMDNYSVEPLEQLYLTPIHLKLVGVVNE